MSQADDFDGFVRSASAGGPAEREAAHSATGGNFDPDSEAGRDEAERAAEVALEVAAARTVNDLHDLTVGRAAPDYRPPPADDALQRVADDAARQFHDLTYDGSSNTAASAAPDGGTAPIPGPDPGVDGSVGDPVDGFSATDAAWDDPTPTLPDDFGPSTPSFDTDPSQPMIPAPTDATGATGAADAIFGSAGGDDDLDDSAPSPPDFGLGDPTTPDVTADPPAWTPDDSYDPVPTVLYDTPETDYPSGDEGGE